MSKNIVICLDGTGNEVKAKAVTNVLKVAEYADLAHPDTQVLYYGPGVGTMPAPNAWSVAAQRLSIIGGLALGEGMRQDIADAYTYLMNTWIPGDKVFVFGFSRGAFTARALCGMLYRVGLLHLGSENLVPYAVRVYARGRGDDADLEGPEGWDRIDKFSKVLAQRVRGDSRMFPIEYLGVFDTVKATFGFGRDISWPYTRSLPNVRVVRHAVSIDEGRRLYKDYLVNRSPKEAWPEKLSEVWFAGVHSDVGGGFVDNPELGLITMRWVLDGAIRCGLHVKPQTYVRRLGHLGASDAVAPMHQNGGLWRFAQSPRHWFDRSKQVRQIPDGAIIHESVKIRCDDVIAAYRPKLPSDHGVETEAWSGPAPAPDPVG